MKKTKNSAPFGSKTDAPKAVKNEGGISWPTY